MSTLARQKSNDQAIEFRPVSEDFCVSNKPGSDVAKRVIDLVGASCAVLILSPIMIVVTLLIRLTSPGPIIFRQQRLGYRDRVFSCYKFRTMHKDAEARLKELEAFNEQPEGVLFKMKKDPRITPVGKFLRRTSLDELPQFFNVIFGDMSLVGPRPLPLRDCELLKAQDPDAAALRTTVRPGITGLWQISGRSALSVTGMVELDRTYVEKSSCLFDLAILVRTFKVVLLCKNAY